MLTHDKTIPQPDDNFHDGFHHSLCRNRRMFITSPAFPGPDSLTRSRPDAVNDCAFRNGITAIGFPGKLLPAGKRRQECF
jgi:hypothetical protein